MKNRILLNSAAVLVTAIGFVTIVASGGGTTPSNTCAVTGGMSATGAGSGSRERAGIAFVCAGEQVKLDWSHTNAQSATISFNNAAGSNVPVTGDTVITVFKDVVIDMTAAGEDCSKHTSVELHAMHDGDVRIVNLSHPNWNLNEVHAWSGVELGAPITNGLRVKAVMLGSNCDLPSWNFVKMDNDGVQHQFTLNAGVTTDVNFHPAGVYKAFPNATIGELGCDISIRLILGCN